MSDQEVKPKTFNELSRRFKDCFFEIVVLNTGVQRMIQENQPVEWLEVARRQFELFEEMKKEYTNDERI